MHEKEANLFNHVEPMTAGLADLVGAASELVGRPVAVNELIDVEDDECVAPYVTPLKTNSRAPSYGGRLNARCLRLGISSQAVLENCGVSRPTIRRV
jgi:hypothetical protein